MHFAKYNNNNNWKAANGERNLQAVFVAMKSRAQP